ncbi:PH domain-containing protein [Streptomyces stramineus]
MALPRTPHPPGALHLDGRALGSLALTALATGGRLDLRAWITLGVIAAVFAGISTAGLITWRRTRYRVTADSFELRTGLFTRRVRAIPLHRIRNVDLTANPVQRVLGLSVLRAGMAGTGRSCPWRPSPAARPSGCGPSSWPARGPRAPTTLSSPRPTRGGCATRR